MVKLKMLPSTYERVGLASASIAANLNRNCLVDYQMKIEYPIIVYRILTCKDNLEDIISALDPRPYTTLLLSSGQYHLNKVMTTKSAQIISIEDDVEIFLKNHICIYRYPDEVFKINLKRQKEIFMHFENIHFIRDCARIVVENNTFATFFKCKLSNGEKGCDDFPRCNGGKGCKNNPPCSMATVGNCGCANRIIGLPGYPGVCAQNGGKAMTTVFLIGMVVAAFLQLATDR